MHDRLTEGRDALTNLLLRLRLQGVEYGRCQMHGPWAFSFPPQEAASFHFVARGGGWLRTAAMPSWLRLEAGDAVLLPHGGFHVMASRPDAPAVDLQALSRVTVAQNIYLVRGESNAHGPAPDVMFCGRMRFDLDPLHPLIGLMPEVIRAGELARRDPAVPVLLEAMERELAQDRVGAHGILARLADVLAASILRAWVECSCSDAGDWLAAMRCPKVGRVLAAIHAEPERAWSVPALARLMGASRSSFTEAFTRTVGQSPARYVAHLKMAQARRWIAQEGMRVSTAALRLGYESEAAFSRAFKRVLGHPPSATPR